MKEWALDIKGRSHRYVRRLVAVLEGDGELPFPTAASAGYRLGSNYNPVAVRGLNLPMFSGGQMMISSAGEDVSAMPAPIRGRLGKSPLSSE